HETGSLRCRSEPDPRPHKQIPSHVREERAEHPAPPGSRRLRRNYAGRLRRHRLKPPIGLHAPLKMAIHGSLVFANWRDRKQLEMMALLTGHHRRQELEAVRDRLL